jgi:hypothetical protein
MTHNLTDTSPEAADRLRHLFGARSGEQRLRMACEMFDSARRLAVASLPMLVLHDPLERRVSLLRRFYRRDLAPAALEAIVSTLRRPPHAGISRDSTRILTEDERAQMRQWLATWKQAGPLLEEERAARTRALSDAEAAAIAVDLWQLARSGGGDNGEGLLLVSRTLLKLEIP